MTTLNLQVAAGADDASEQSNGAGFDGTGINVRCDAATGSTRRFGGFRFSGVTIPQGATIFTAVLVVEPESSGVDDARVVISAEDVDDAVNFVTDADVVSRIRTETTVDWTQDGVAVGGSSPDISAIVKEVIDRAGWVSGNALVVFMDGKSDLNKQFRPASFEHSTRNPVKLDITYAVIFPVAVGGMVAPVGVSTGLMGKVFAGAIVPIGLHIGLLSKVFAGAITPSATLAFLTPLTSSLAGALTPAGAISAVRSLNAIIDGALTPVGQFQGMFANFFTGVISSAGTFGFVGIFTRTGALQPTGTIAVVRNMFLQGLISPAGEALHQFIKTFSGVLGMVGAMSFLTPPMRVVGRLRAFITDRDGTPRGHILP